MARPLPVTLTAALLLRVEGDVGLFVTLDDVEPIEVYLNTYRYRRVTATTKLFPVYKLCIFKTVPIDNPGQSTLFGSVCAKPQLISMQGKRFKNRLCAILGWEGD